jgi:hypothetical protein
LGGSDGAHLAAGSAAALGVTSAEVRKGAGVAGGGHTVAARSAGTAAAVANWLANAIAASISAGEHESPVAADGAVTLGKARTGAGALSVGAAEAEDLASTWATLGAGAGGR